MFDVENPREWYCVLSFLFECAAEGDHSKVWGLQLMRNQCAALASFCNMGANGITHEAWNVASCVLFLPCPVQTRL